MKRTRVILAFVLSGLPIAIYPMALIANLMSIAGVSSGNDSILMLAA